MIKNNSTPLKGPSSRFMITTKKKQDKSKQYVSYQYQRFKTEPNQITNPVFPIHFSAQRRISTREKDSKRQYSSIRQHQLRKEYNTFKTPIKIREATYSNKKSSQKMIQRLQQKFDKKPYFSQQLTNVKLKDLQCNIKHLLLIYASLLKKKYQKQLLQCIKHYILQEESDLNQLQLCLKDEKDRIIVKNLIYSQRLLLILLVQSLISKRYRFNQNNFLQLFRDLFSFYAFMYFQLTKKSIETLIDSQNVEILQSHFTQNLSQFSLSSLKESFSKKINIIAKQFNDIDRFIAEQYMRIKEFPSNLLYYNILQFYAGRLAGGDWNGWGIQFLQTCPSPYVHHLPEHKYTLMLDLDETLVHYRVISQVKGEFLLRPYLYQFLSKVQPYFEVGVFTCALQTYADLILEHLPAITIRLYRQHAVKIGKQLIKDLSRVGRDLSRIILVDNLQKNFKLQKQNGIHVRSWFGDPTDNVLNQLATQLISLAQNAPEDLRLSKHKRSFL